MITQQIDRILKVLLLNDSKNPRKDRALAQSLEMEMPAFEALMDQVCNIVPAPVNRAKIKRVDFEGYVYWPTGVVDKASWESFTPAKAKTKESVSTAVSTPKVSADTNVIPELMPVAAADVDARPEIQFDLAAYADRNKSYQILKFIEANAGRTDREIQQVLEIDCSVHGFLKPYMAHVKFGDFQGKRTFSLTLPVDDFYRKKKHGPAPKAAALLRDSDPKVIDQQVEQLSSAIETLSKPITGRTPVEFNDGLPFRCAYTSDLCLMFFLEGEVEPIELTPQDTMTVINFISDRIMPIAVEIA